MNQLPTQALARMIEQMESGELTDAQAGQQLAKVSLAKSEPYTKTIIGGLLLAGVAWAMTSSAIIPIALIILTFDKLTDTRKRREEGYRNISKGDFLEYLPEYDREIFEKVVNQVENTEASPAIDTTAVTVEDAEEQTIEQSDILNREPQTPTELIQRLKAECPALYKLLKSPPIRMVGAQRTGKSTLTKILVMLRLACIKGHSVVTAMPHDEDGAYPSVLNPVGNIEGSRDYASIKAHWLAYADRIERCQKSNITTIWDEFGLFDKFLSDEQLQSVLTASLRESTKHQEYPIFILHGETKAFMPGSDGIVKILKTSTVRVETIGELVEGSDGLEEMRPTGKFRVTMLDGQKIDGQIPAWLTEGYLITVLSKIQLTPPPTISKQSAPTADDFRAKEVEPPKLPTTTKAKTAPVHGLTTDPVLEAIDRQPEGDHKTALIIGYRWASNRIESGKPVDFDSFKNRAKTERQSEYLRTHIDEVWSDIESLISA